MDWSKAKNILIISFILTNIFLAYVLYSVNQDEEKIEIQDEFIEDVIELLAQKSIKIDTEVPKEIPSLNIASIEYEVYDAVKIAKKFLHNYTEELIGDKKVYRNGKKTIKFQDNNKRLIYKDESLLNNERKNDLTKENAIKTAEEFINTHEFDLKNTELSLVLEQNGIYKLFYNKVLGDVAVEQSDMVIEVSSNGVISFERYWIKNIEKQNQILKLTSAPKALLRLLARDEYSGNTIKKIEICYYFNIDDYKEDANLKDSKGGLAVPTWKIVFQDGEKVFLEEN